MKDDYLWDRTGEPDPEIQKLETILGELRYQPRPLTIPADVNVGRRHSFFRDFGPRLAIAATIAMLVVGLGVWLAVQRLNSKESPALVQAPKVTPEITPVRNDQSQVVAKKSADDREQIEVQRHPQPKRRPPAVNTNRLRNVTAKNRQLTADEREGEAAKDQLMLALRLASAKLNFAQKKTQSASPRELIHNQHKIG